MSHFALVIDGIVENVIVAEQDFIDTLPNKDHWIQTSYNTVGGLHYDPETGVPDGKPALRKNFAVVGGTYNPILDAFIPPKDYESWTLNTDTCLWEPPIACPDDENTYLWNEDTLSWELINLQDL